MARVIVRILHPPLAPSAAPLEHRLAEARLSGAERHVASFRRAGAEDVAMLSEPADDTPFGARLRRLVATASECEAGLVVVGSGSMPLATLADRRRFVEVAAGLQGPRTALANNRYSADAIAIADPSALPPIPDLPNDNALPRWLAERAGWTVTDLGRSWRLRVDLDSPLDVELTFPGRDADPELDLVRARLAALQAVAADRRAELLVAGRTSAATVRWLESNTRCRVRAFIEERGLRASSRLALGGDEDGARSRPDRPPGRPPRSILGLALDRDGPETLGVLLSVLADGALVDTRVLLAHRLGADEHSWPSAEDRFASDLLLADRIGDPWLRALTAAAATAEIPIALGGHSLVGPGVRLALRHRGARAAGSAPRG
ncbi:MAG: hypothetical protein IVW53_03385 [Chloroflexi bacterium]|nr:hypothetical protein [Chloroflexota bacterium]